MKLLSFLAGCGLIGVATHASVIALGGYDGSPAMFIQCAAGVGVPVGAVASSAAWSSRRYALALLMVIGLISGEAFALLSTSERVLNAREASQSHIVSSAVSREAAQRRLTKAEDAKLRADEAAIAEAAKPGCKDRCVALLADAKTAAERELAEVRKLLGAMPAPRSVSPLADKLGLPAWCLDLLAAALSSLSVNILGAALIAFAAHTKDNRIIDAVATKVEQPRVFEALPPPAAPLPATPSTREHAADFIATSLRRDPAARVHARDLHSAYLDHCRELDISPRPDIGVELAVLLRALGLTMAADQYIGGARLIGGTARRLRQVA
jgi:hypothetical protein